MKRITIPIAAILLAVTAVGLVLEAGLRAALFVRERAGLRRPDQLDLDEYEAADPAKPGLWRLRPGFQATLQEAIDAKRTARRSLGERHLVERGKALGISLSETIYRINGDGFKGPEIDKTHSKYRILAIGDSCTFDPLIDRYAYARVLERRLEALGGRVEVINAGVEGYSPSHALERIEEFKALRPEMATVYIGWNALFMEPLAGPELAIFRFVRAARARLDPQAAALAAYSRPKAPDPADPFLDKLENFQPSFGRQVEAIIDEMTKAGSRVAVVTLPGLFSTKRPPTDRALSVGHLPLFTNNPYVLARMAERYNEWLRGLAASRRVLLIDLERWGETELQPAESYFYDSVHLYEHGTEKIGMYMASQIEPMVVKR